MSEYKKPNKKVEKSYLKNKIKEIPLYDPQTGEPNLEYEKITGQPNPLIQNDYSVEREGPENIIKEMRKIQKLIPNNLEFKKTNRFLVHLPKEFNVTPLQIESVRTSSYKTLRNPILSMLKRVVLSDTIITIREIEGTNIMKNLINKMNKKFDFTIEIVNGQNIVIEKWVMKDCFISNLTNNRLSYGDDDILKTTITITPNKMEMN
jgi:hypothetical protein